MIAKHQIEKLENCHKYLESKNSSTDFSVLKLAEELTELSSVLIKYSNKPTKREALEKNIAEEMDGIHGWSNLWKILKILENHFNTV